MNETRRTNRVPLQCDVEFRRQGQPRFVVELLDFSPEGCCISPPVKVNVGDQVSLRIPDMEPVRGTIAWTREWKSGVEFDHPFHPAVFDLVVKKLSAPSAS